MRIHLVFYMSLLEPADPDTPLEKGIQLDESTLEPEYEVEKILQHAVSGRGFKYLKK
jgi:hypothetical protein